MNDGASKLAEGAIIDPGVDASELEKIGFGKTQEAVASQPSSPLSE